jgi:hypothetical protein
MSVGARRWNLSSFHLTKMYIEILGWNSVKQSMTKRLLLLIVYGAAYIVCELPQVLTLAQETSHQESIAYRLHRGLIEEAAQRKRVRYALLRKGYADALSCVVQRDTWGSTLSLFKTLLLKEFYLPHSPLGFRAHPSMPFVKFPPDQDVYVDPWAE